MVCLNPCFNGRYSQRVAEYKQARVFKSLNPCFNGRYSQRRKKTMFTYILNSVLILVLMEDTLRGRYSYIGAAEKRRLNPCFNGRYSQR